MSATSPERIATRSVAVVTGAGRMRGIGRAVAVQLAADGFDVVVHERTSDHAALLPAEAAAGWRGAASVAEEIESLGCRAVTVAGDITAEATAERLVEAAGAVGRLAVLVDNHGSAGEANTHLAHETPESLWDDTFRVNVGSLRTITSVVVPAMAAAPGVGGSIVHVSSTAGHRALPRYGAYCVSKAAVERLTEQQALELARFGIRVNCVAPGMTPTDMIDGTLDRAAARSNRARAEIEAAAVRGIPLRRLATVDDIAEAIVFLAGARSSYITGQILTVDGGMTLV